MEEYHLQKKATMLFSFVGYKSEIEIKLKMNSLHFFHVMNPFKRVTKCQECCIKDKFVDRSIFWNFPNFVLGRLYCDNSISYLWNIIRIFDTKIFLQLFNYNFTIPAL